MKTTKALFGLVTVAAGLMAQTVICSAATWEGTDDFSAGLSTLRWTVYQYSQGQMLAAGVNGHVSYIVPISTVDHQEAYISWNGTPAVSNDWTIDIFGHNSAGWSTNGKSALLLAVANPANMSTSYVLAMSRDATGQHFMTVSSQAPAGDEVFRQSVPATNADFGLRLVHRGGVAGNVEAWYDPVGNGFAWTLLDTMSMAAFWPGAGATNAFLVAIDASSRYGPIVEGDIWVDNFRITNSALGSVVQPQISLVRAVKPSFSNLTLTASYQLQVSSDLSNWTNQGSPFTATNSSMVYPQYWDVNNWGQLFFRLQVAP